MASTQEAEKAAEDKASAAKNTADSASQKAQAAKTVNDEAQAAKAEQEGNVNQAQNKVDQAQKAVDDLGLPKLAEDLENAKTANSSAQKNLTDAKSADQAAAENLEKANSDQAAKDQEKAEAQKAVDQVSSQVKKLTDADDKAKAASDAANKDLAAKKAAESKAEQEYQALPKVVANDTLKQATQAFAPFEKLHGKRQIDDSEYYKALDVWIDAMKAGEGLNTYHGLDSDKNIKVDLNNLTQEQQNELNAYVVQLINSAWKGLGTAELAGTVVGSVGANSAASEIAAGYRNDHWNSSVGHDNAVVNSIAQKYGLLSLADKNQQAIENLATKANTGWKSQADDQVTMYDAKGEIFEGIVSMLYADDGSNMGHAISLLGLDTLMFTKSGPDVTTYIGVSSNGSDIGSSLINGHIYYHLHQYHFIVVPTLADEDNVAYGTISDQSTWEKAKGIKTLPNPYDEAAVKEKLTKAQEATAAAQKTADEKAAALKTAAAKLAQGNQELASAESNLAAKQGAFTTANETLAAANQAKTESSGN